MVQCQEGTRANASCSSEQHLRLLVAQSMICSMIHEALQALKVTSIANNDPAQLKGGRKVHI